MPRIPYRSFFQYFPLTSTSSVPSRVLRLESGAIVNGQRIEFPVPWQPMAIPLTFVVALLEVGLALRSSEKGCMGNGLE